MKLGFVITLLCCSIALALSQVKNEIESIGEYLEGLAKEKPTFAGHEHHKIIGETVAGAKLLNNVKIEQPYACCFSKGHAEVHFKKNNYRITLIEVVNNHPAGNGSATYKVFGGVGKSHVDIDFASESRSGIYYTVNIYGVSENASGEESVGEVGIVGATERKHVGGSGDRNFGEHEAGEVLLHSQDIKQGWSCCGWREYAEMHVKKNNYRITVIEFRNLWDRMAASYDIYGGIGENYADIYFTSLPYAGIWYNVKIYGVPA